MDAQVLKALADLAWPVLAAIVLFALLPTIIRIVRSRSFSIKYGDMELSVQDASEQMRKQIEDLQNQVRGLQGARQSGDVVTRSSTPQPAFDETRSGLILWVDDNPQNNAHEIAKLQDEGWEISAAESTTAALTLLQNRSALPTLIISDMSRREGITYRKTAGLDLIREVRARGITVPILIYASGRAVREHREQVEELGGAGITASPIELFGMIEKSTAQQIASADG